MSFVEQKCVIITCDECGDEEFGHDYIPHFPSLAHALNSDVYEVGGKHYCENCYSEVAEPEEAGSPFGKLLGFVSSDGAAS